MPVNEEFCARRSLKLRCDSGRLPGLRWSVVETSISACGSWTGRGRSSTALTRLKIAVLAPMPSASDNTATSVNPGLLASIRRPYLMSCMVGLRNADDQTLMRDVEAAFFQLALALGALAAVLFDDPAVEQVNRAIGVARVARVVRDHADRRPFTVQLAEQFHDRFAVLRVEVSGRLVGEQD